MTAAPYLASEQPSEHIVSMTVYTSNGAVYEIAIEEMDITVTYYGRCFGPFHFTNIKMCVLRSWLSKLQHADSQH